MNRISIRALTFAAATATTGLASFSSLAAEPSLTVVIGQQPPPHPREDHRWASPDHSAVWIPGHNEWTDGAYVWVGGYYSYPPRPHSHWVGPTYPHNETGYSYHPGHWSE